MKKTEVTEQVTNLEEDANGRGRREVMLSVSEWRCGEGKWEEREDSDNDIHEGHGLV